MQRVRALYEDSAVPVREIAAIAGVTERTLYTYVQKHDWKRRYRVLPRGREAAAANRGRRWRASPDVQPAKGAGGRFIRREDKDKPFASGLKALDPAGRRRAEARCAAAEPLAREARFEADKEEWFKARTQMSATFNRALGAYTDYLDEYRKNHSGRTPPEDDPTGRGFWRIVQVAGDYWASMRESEKQWMAEHWPEYCGGA